MPVDTTYPLDDVLVALEETRSQRRTGKAIVIM
jgi:hypothetical protein